MAGFLMERYWPGVTAADVDAVCQRLTELGDADATFVASTLIPADEVVFFEFRAVDDAAVLKLARRADFVKSDVGGRWIRSHADQHNGPT
jgi:hypothetical protein